MKPRLETLGDPLADQIARLLDEDTARPWCVHRLLEQLYPDLPESQRERELARVYRSADELSLAGRAHRETVSAVSIGIHCDDTLYWSRGAQREHLSEFGPEFESPTILRRLGEHIVCRGL